MKNKIHHYIFTFLIGFFWIFGQLRAQTFEHVNLINGDIFLSEAVVENNNNRLASELDASQYDVHLSYVINYLPVEDRFGTYDGMEFIPFLNTPADGTPSPPTSDELAVHTRNTVDHIIVNAGGVGTKAIHIIYTASVYLDEAFKVNYQLDKHYIFGSDISKIDKLKLKQIEAEREFSISTTAEENDEYLNEYVDLIIGAMNDPDYVVTGTVRYEDDIYVDGDTIFYFWDHVTMIDGPMAGREWLELLVNARYPVNNISWAEFNSSSPMIEEEDEEDVFLRLNSEHFRGIQELKASFGETTTTVYFYPINLQIHLEGNDEIEYLEPFAPTSDYPITAYNNGRYFTHHHGLNIRTRIERDNGSFLDHQSISFAPSGNDQLVFGIEELGLSRSDGRRFFINLEAIKPSGEILYTRKRRIFVKWPFDLEELVVTPTDNEGDLQPNRKVLGGSSETLYIVSSDNDLTRNVQFKLDWDGVQPSEAIDYWDYSTAIGEEPVYYFGKNPTDPLFLNAPPSLVDRRLGPILVEYDSRFFPGAGILNPDLGTLDINEYKAGVHVFDQHKDINIAFLRENRHSLDLDISFLADMFGIIGGTMLQAGYELLQNGGNVPGLPGNSPSGGGSSSNQSTPSTGSMFEPYYNWNHTGFNQEDSNSPSYLNIREQSVSVGVESKPKKLELPWPRIPPNPLVEGYFYMRFSGNVGFAYERASQKFFNESQYKFAAQTIELAGGVSFDVGGTIKLASTLAQTVKDNIEFNVDVFLSYPFEVKGKIEFPSSEETESCINLYREFNHGPGALNLNVELKFAGDVNGWEYDWTLLNINHAWPLTDKVINTCCYVWEANPGCLPDLECNCN